jgi:uncharacterized membrane protein
MKSKSAPKKMEDESVEEEAVIDEVSLDEMSPELEEDTTLDEAKKKKAAKKDKEEKEEKEVVNESFLKMQKLAGLITESEFQKKKAKNLKEEILNENISDKAKNFILKNHNPGEEEDHITYEYPLNKIDKEIVNYIKNKGRLNVTVKGQTAAMTIKNNTVIVEFF